MPEVASSKELLNRKQQVADHLHSAAIHLLRRLRLQDESAGIGPAKLSALSILVFAGPRSIGELAKMEQVQPPTMTRIVDGLEEEGFVIRKVDGADRRSLQIQATSKGTKLLQNARARRIQDLSNRIENLSVSDLHHLEQASKIIEEVLR